MPEPGEVDGRTTGQPRSSGLALVGLLVGAVLAAVLIGQLTSPDPSPRTPAAVAPATAANPTATPGTDPPIGVESLKRCPVTMGALALGDTFTTPGWSVEQWDCAVLKQGPWSIVIRATDGHFGVKGAVVAFPVNDAESGAPVATPPGGRWNSTAHTLIFPLGSSYAQIVGDLGQSTLENLAARVTEVAGRPRFAALDGFAVVATTTYRSPVVHEMRYSATELGQKSTLGDGLVFTGVTWAASFETLAFESHAEPAGFVRGKPAVYSSALGGSGTLAWESAPGQVSYVGYSGGPSSPSVIDHLRALADQGRMLTPTQWETRNRAQINAQTATSP